MRTPRHRPCARRSLPLAAAAILLAAGCATGGAAPEETPTALPSAAAESPAAPAEVVATVDGEAILRSDWRTAAAIDQAMSRLAAQPAPGAEETLDRLINTRLVLRAAAAANMAASPAYAEQRLKQMQSDWGVDDARLASTLAEFGVSRQELLAEMQRLLVVESYLDKLAAAQDPAAWLADQRRQARVSILGDLAAAAAGPRAASVALPDARALPTPLATPAVRPTDDEAPANPPFAAPATGTTPGDLAPEFVLADVNDQPVRLSQFRGQPVVLNFWASWCGPCRAEAAEFRAFSERYNGRATVLGIDLREEPSAVRDFASAAGLAYPLLMDRDGAVSDRYQVRGIPTTLVIDPAGVVRRRHVGPLTAEQLARYVEPYLAPAAAPTEGAGAPEQPLAPDFVLPRHDGELVRLSDFRDKQSVVLVFYRGQT